MLDEESNVSSVTAACSKDLHREEMFGRGGGYAKPGMIEDAFGRRISARGDIDARLLVEPPGRQPEFPGKGAGLIQHDAVGFEDRVDVAG